MAVVAAWHSYRLPIIILSALTFALLAIRRVWSRRKEFQRLTSSPLLGIPTLTAELPEKISRLQPPSSSSVISDKNKIVSLDKSYNVLKTRELGFLDAKTHRSLPKRVKGSRVGLGSNNSRTSENDQPSESLTIKPLIFFSSLTGSTESCVKKLVEDLTKTLCEVQSSSFLKPQLHDLSYVDYEDFFVTAPKLPETPASIKYFYLLVLPTYNIDTILNNFLNHLDETHNDFRIGVGSLSGILGYSVFGFGDKEGWPTEEEGFCSQAREVDRWMAKLTNGKRAFPLGMGDVKSDAVERLEEWRAGVEDVLQGIANAGTLGEGYIGSGDAFESGEEGNEAEDVPSSISNQNLEPQTSRKRRRLPKPTDVDDLEDLGQKTPIPIDFTTSNASASSAITTTETLKPMVPATSPTHAALTKQGYTIIGSHSGVKICRWTKSALRGRGSCYKYSFYGIASHTCMETTPSLSCSNKCVFCWRHGTNPVGTTWRWQVDPPDLILNGAIAAHYQKIKSLRGVPGVRASRFAEAMNIRHCALSLVGEPIFYPHINAFLSLLHAKRISSFLVCNAQHPDQLAALAPVTQLYVSIDASNRESLRKIDRPLHRDFWERFQRCLDILREKRHSVRTVFRLTLVKGFNITDEVDGYAALVARGLPCFVEIKGVTYCGTTSSSAGLTMQNVPFYEEVVAFVEALDAALAKRGLEYGIAAEHKHSCCVLLASKRFLVGGKWHTLIDYDGFFRCLERGGSFAPEDYMGAETPEWATWGRGGFDPRDERVDRKGRKIEAVNEAA